MDSPIRCLAPMIGVVLGIAFGAYMASKLPSGWDSELQTVWIPRLLGLVTAAFLWATGIMIRGKRLHCGGTVPATTGDVTKYGILLPVLFISIVVMMVAYVSGEATLFFGLMVCILLTLIGEIGWGVPWHILKVLSRRTRS